MRIHNVGALCGYGGDIISDYEYVDLKRFGFEEVWYAYETQPYEGSGQLLAIDKTGNYYLADMGHCSCNGPIDNVSTKQPFKTLDEVRSMCSPGYLEWVEPLLQAAMVSLMGHN